jgi:hypothetical protein
MYGELLRKVADGLLPVTTVAAGISLAAWLFL